MVRRKIPLSTKLKVLRLKQEGADHRNIAEQLNVSTGSVSLWSRSADQIISEAKKLCKGIEITDIYDDRGKIELGKLIEATKEAEDAVQTEQGTDKKTEGRPENRLEKSLTREATSQLRKNLRKFMEKNTWFNEVLNEVGFQSLVIALQLAEISPSEAFENLEEFRDPEKFRQFIGKYLSALWQARDEAKRIMELEQELKEAKKVIGIATVAWNGLKQVKDQSDRLTLMAASLMNSQQKQQFLNMAYISNLYNANPFLKQLEKR